VEVVSDAEDKSLVLLDSLDLVSPLSGNLDSGLGGLNTRVHGQDHLIAKDLANLLGPLGKYVIVKCSRGQRQATGLFSQSLDKLRVAMALVDGTVRRKKIKVLAALGVPDIYALGPGEDNGKRVVVVSSELILGLDCGLR
jgi:hypothetical protein